MENVEIARILGKYADLLEIQGGDVFRVIAYRNAARTVESLSQPIAQLLAEGKNLKKLKLPGIGASMAGHIGEIVRTGTFQSLETIEKTLPASLDELLMIEGLGPKRTKLLYEKLGIASISQLEQAIESGQVAMLPGFGAKSVEKIRQGIRNIAGRPQRLKIFDADQIVRPLVEHLRRGRGIEQIEVAGSYRRRMETIGDLDVLVASEHPEPIMQHFQSYPEVARVLASGSTRSTVVLRSGLQVDLRILPNRCYGAALHYFTGSKAHNIAVRKLGVERGLRISEYGVFRVPRGKDAEETGVEEGERIGGAREQDVFAAVGLDWVPPELREDRGEIEAAQKHALPKLVVPADLRGDLHMHTRWTDGKHTILEMARACKERGYQYCAITDHTRAATVAGGLSADDFKRQREEIEKARIKVPGIAIWAGCELDILADGSLDLPDAFLEQFDLVVAAVHSKMDLDKNAMTRRVLRALEHPAVDILAHPTGRLIHRRDPFEIDLEAVFHAARERGIALELNAQPDRLDLNDLHVFRARQLGVKIAINTDAHSVEQLGFVRYGVDQGRRGWLEKQHVLNAMPRPRLERWLRQRRNGAAERVAI